MTDRARAAAGLDVMDHCRLLLRGVAVLHSRGYGLARIVSGMAPSGMYWRLTVVSSRDLDASDPMGRTVRTGAEPIWWTSGQSPEFAGVEMTTRTTPDEVADVVLRTLGERSLRGEDTAYTRWYAGLLTECERAGTVPVAFSDSWEPHGWQVGFGGPDHEPPPPPPLG